MRLAIRLVVPKHRIGVNVVCLDADKNILLLRHLFHPVAPWGLPGGWMDRHESPAECAARELREETGLISKNAGQVINICRNPRPDHINIIYLTEVEGVKPEVNIDGLEIVDSKWINPESAPETLTSETVLALKKSWKMQDVPFDFPETQEVKNSF